MTMIRRRYNCTFLKAFTLLWCCLVVLFLFNYQTTHNERLIQLEKEMSQKQEIQEIQVAKSQNKVLMINPLHRLKPNTYIKLNTKTQNIFCCLNENLTNFL